MMQDSLKQFATALKQAVTGNTTPKQLEPVVPGSQAELYSHFSNDFEAPAGAVRKAKLIQQRIDKVSAVREVTNPIMLSRLIQERSAKIVTDAIAGNPALCDGTLSRAALEEDMQLRKPLLNIALQQLCQESTPFIKEILTAFRKNLDKDLEEIMSDHKKHCGITGYEHPESDAVSLVRTAIARVDATLALPTTGEPKRVLQGIVNI
jgi:hypothetical protein